MKLSILVYCFLLFNVSVISASTLEVLEEENYLSNSQEREIGFSSDNKEDDLINESRRLLNAESYQIVRANPEEGNILAEISYSDTIKNIVRFCTPNLFASLSVMVNGIWNSHLYGELGGDALASEAIAMMWSHLLVTTALGGLKTTLITASQLNSRNDSGLSTAIGNVNKSALVLTAFYSSLAIPLLLEAANIIESFGIIKDPGILKQVQSYSNGFAWGMPATLFLINDEQFSLAVKDNYIPLICGGLQYGLSSLFAYPLALGKWGSPKLEAGGIGHAMSAGAWVTWLILRSYYMCNKTYAPYKLLDFSTVRWKGLKKYMNYAAPLAVSDSIALTQNFFYTQFITGAGNDVAQANSSASAFFKQLNSALWSYGSSVSALVGNSSPKRFLEDDLLQKIAINNSKRLVQSAVLLTLGFAALVSTPALIWEDSFINFFGGGDLSEETTKLTKLYIWYNFGNTLLNGYLAPLESSLFGLEDIMTPVMIDLGVDFITISLAALAATYAHSSHLLVAASLLGNAIGAIGYSIRWWQISRNFLKVKTSDNKVICKPCRRWWEIDTSLDESFA